MTALSPSALPPDTPEPHPTMRERLDCAPRRRWLKQGIAITASGLLAGHAPQAQARIPDLNEAINRAGRQRMLSQRMAKAWLALGQGVDPRRAERILHESIQLFDQQLADLLAYAPTTPIQNTYTALGPVWLGYKRSLLQGPPHSDRADDILRWDGQVLALAHQGTQQLEAQSGRNLGKLVNISGRQRMLSQRAAKLYLRQAWRLADDGVLRALTQARQEFASSLVLLRDAKEATTSIREEVDLARQQWVFFDNALTQASQGGQMAQHAQEVFASSEHILQIMDRVTAMFSRLGG